MNRKINYVHNLKFAAPKHDEFEFQYEDNLENIFESSNTTTTTTKS